MYLRPDVASAWQGRDALQAAFALRGETLRAMRDRRTLAVEVGGRAYVAKLHEGAGIGEIVKNLLLGRAPVLGAGNEYAALRRLHAAGVPSMEVAAFGEADARALRRRSFILLDRIEHDESLEDVARRWRRAPPTAPQRRARVLEVARIARAMHAAGVNHRDFYLCHFLCARDGGLRLIDLHRAGCRAQVPERWRVKDLAALWFSAMDAGLTPRDRLAFIRAYLGGRLPRDASGWQRWQRVQRRAEALYRKGVRLGIAG